MQKVPVFFSEFPLYDTIIQTQILTQKHNRNTLKKKKKKKKGAGPRTKTPLSTLTGSTNLSTDKLKNKGRNRWNILVFYPKLNKQKTESTPRNMGTLHVPIMLKHRIPTSPLRKANPIIQWVSQSISPQATKSSHWKKKRITSTRRQAASKQELCADLEHEHAASRVADDAQG